MSKRQVNIAGIPTGIEEKEIEIKSIEFDRDNPRISFFKDVQPHDLNQKEITYALKNKNPQAFRKLKESIKANKGIIYPIWIIPLGKGVYRVIEGNTRLIIYRELNEEFLNDKTYLIIPCWILPESIEEEQMSFIRLEAHLRGTTDWDTYERARYLYVLNVEEGFSIRMLERLTKLKRDEIETAIKAFKDMEQQYLPKYGKDPSEVHKFSYFVEFEKNTKLQEIMKKNNFSVEDLCDWVGEGKITRAPDVRELPDILSYDSVREEFIKKGFDYAIEILDVIKPDKTSKLFQYVERVVDGLNNIPSWEITEMKKGNQPNRVEIINKLNRTVMQTIKLIEG